MEALDCFLCSEPYNTSNKAPRFLQCGHTYCTECCQIILDNKPSECPEDSTPITYSSIESIPKNQALLKLLSNSKICPIHKNKQEYVCINCKTQICSRCALMGAHRDHEIKRMEEVKQEVFMQATLLVDMLEIIDKTENELSGTIMVKLEETAEIYDKKRTEIEKLIKSEFMQMRSQIDQLEKSVLKDLEKHFDDIENVIASSREFPKVIYKQAGEWKDMARNLLESIDTKNQDPSSILFKMLASSNVELFQAGEKLLTDLEGIKDIKIEKIIEDIQALGVEFVKGVIPTLCKVVKKPVKRFNDSYEIGQSNILDSFESNKNSD